MKCYITLPKDLSRITKMQVKKNVWNQDIKKKETYAMFTSKKHGGENNDLCDSSYQRNDSRR